MLLQTILLILAIPAGFLIAYLANDELVQGRKWFKTLMLLSFLLAVFFAFAKNYTPALTSAFILITTSISYIKSFDKKFTKRNIK